MTRTADRKHRQPTNTVLTLILLEQFTRVSSADGLRSRLLDLEVRYELPEPIALAVRGCVEILDGQLDDAEALLEGAGSCAHRDEHKAFVLHVRAFLAMQRGEDRQALTLTLRGLWLRSNPRLWALFLCIAHETNRPDVVSATLRGLANAKFLRSEAMRDTLAHDPLLESVRAHETFRLEIAPRLRPRVDN